MNNAISTNDDLMQLATDLLRVQTVQTTRVLVAVSDFALKRLLTGFFQQRKFRSFLAYEKGGNLIQSLVGNKEKALIIYDLELADKNGLELLSIARKQGDPMKNLQIILVTGAITHQVKEKLMAAGANALLTRPVSQDALLECLKDLKIPV